MKAAIELPKAFSVRDACELVPIQDLMARLNPNCWSHKWRQECILTAATPSIGASST